jgi:hypothetical protein
MNCDMTWHVQVRQAKRLALCIAAEWRCRGGQVLARLVTPPPPVRLAVVLAQATFAAQPAVSLRLAAWQRMCCTCQLVLRKFGTNVSV